MYIPESVALQGVEIINEYKNSHNTLKALSQSIGEIVDEIKKVETEIKASINEYHWNRPHSYYKDWKERDIAKRHFKLSALTKRHQELSYQFIDLDNQHTSLNLDLYRKRWLPDWMMKEYEELGF